MFSSVFPAAGDQIPSTTFLGTPWDTDSHENPFSYPSTQEPLFSFSDDSTRKTHSSNSGSDDGSPAVVNPIDERKQRRMISNRESARRSRMRKQKHLENLRNLVNRHKSGNRDLMNRLRFVSHHGQILRRENERLREESAILRQKLWDLHQVTRVWQLQNQLSPSAWPCNNNVNSFNEQNPPSLIT